MTVDESSVRRATVLLSGLIYWAGVYLQARRVRKQIGRSPNLKPRGLKEKVLWAGWFFVIVIWMGQAFVVDQPALGWLFQTCQPVLTRLTLIAGLLLVVFGYGCTLWCYAAMGSAWRIGINRKEKNLLITRGPYRRVRHPIYLFQVVMLAGVLLLLPTPISLIILLVHLLCVWIKANDEESYLRTVHGQEYAQYLSTTGKLLPKLFQSSSSSSSSSSS